MQNPLLESKKFKHWQRTGGVHTSVPATWSPEDLLSFEWLETYQTNEVPKGDKWDTHATDLKLQLEDLYAEWRVPKEPTLHYMCLAPTLSQGLQQAYDSFDAGLKHYNFLKITPGHVSFWHFDSYATFVKTHNIDAKRQNDIQRSAVMMTDWSFGQVLQIGATVYSDWNAGDVFTWSGDTWHGAANFGIEDFTVMQVTYLYG
jgi:hypothetical protein